MLFRSVKQNAREGDLVITLGCGDIIRSMDKVFQKFLRSGIDLSPVGVERREDNNPYFCTVSYTHLMTSAEGEASMTWDAAKSKFTRFKPFDDPLYRDLMELVYILAILEN